jgi:hypothetical protein
MYESSSCIHSSAGRTFLTLLFMCVSSNCVVGCRWINTLKQPLNPFPQQPVCVFPPDATKDEIIAHINNQASRLRAWQSSRVAIRLKQPGMIPVELSADMAVERPLNFRLRAKSLMGEEADFGSNRDLFWFWIKRADPRVITVAHEDLAFVQQQMPIPFEPQWVMEAFGVKSIDPSQYEMENVRDNRVNLISHQTSPSGQPVMKVIGFDLCSGYVVEHSLYDASSRLIARATLGNHLQAGDGIVIPYRLTLEWPQAGVNMRLDLLDAEINPDYTPETVWQLPVNAPAYDLGR